MTYKMNGKWGWCEVHGKASKHASGGRAKESFTFKNHVKLKKKSFINAKQRKPGSNWQIIQTRATTAEDYIGFHCCQPKTII